MSPSLKTHHVGGQEISEPKQIQHASPESEEMDESHTDDFFLEILVENWMVTRHVLQPDQLYSLTSHIVFIDWLALEILQVYERSADTCCPNKTSTAPFALFSDLEPPGFLFLH